MVRFIFTPPHIIKKVNMYVCNSDFFALKKNVKIDIIIWLSYELNLSLGGLRFKVAGLLFEGFNDFFAELYLL